MVQIISHPQLEYAEKILRGAIPKQMENKKGRIVPDFCGMPARSALELAHAEQFPYECVGDKDGKIAFQTPRAGSLLEADLKIVLFTAPSSKESRPAAGTIMPNCIGRDLRDAVNIMNLKGLAPVILGAGIVRDQSPRYGSVVTSAVQCTLSCSFDKKQYAME